MGDISRKGILMIMSNANGWRNPKVFGGAEINTIILMNEIGELDWYVILPAQLHDVFAQKFPAKHLHYFSISTLFKTTNALKDLLQGLIYTWKCVLIGLRNKNNYNLIYSATTNFSDIFPAKIISLLTGRPYVVKYHISIYDEPRLSRIYKNYREEKNSRSDSFIRSVLAKTTIVFLKKAKNVLVVCGYLGEQLKRCGIKEDKIKVNYNGLDFKKLAEFKQETITKRYDLCYIGRIEKNKGLQDIVSVVDEIRVEKPDIATVIIGDGSFLSELKEEIKTKGLEKNIELTGFLGDERYLLLQQSIIFLSPTYAKEGFGLTLLEALFFNVPIVAYTNPVFEEIFSSCGLVKLIDGGRNVLKATILKVLNEEHDNKFDLSIYELEKCVENEKRILFPLI